MSLAIILFILVLQLMAGFMDEIAGKGIGISILAQLFAYACGRLFLLALPVGVLTAALMTYGNMGEHNELAALKSAGIGLGKIGRPMVFLGILLTGLSFWFSFEVVPRANLKFFNLLYDVGKMKAELSLKPGEFYRDIDNYVIRISDRNVERKTLYDIMIYNHGENRGAVDIISADSARMGTNREDPTSLKMVLYSGVRHEDFKPEVGDKSSNNYGRTYFDSLHYRFKLKGFELIPTDEKLFSRFQYTLNQRKLGNRIDTFCLQNDRIEQQMQDLDVQENYLAHLEQKQSRLGKKIDHYLHEYHFRMAGPMNVLFFMLIGMALGAIIRKGGLGVPALIATFLLVFSYILSSQGKRLAQAGILDPVWSAWIPAIIFGLLAIFFMYKAAMESQWMVSENWRKLLGKFNSFSGVEAED
jgi:lipopolysaccharide export system permease protein